MLLELLDCLNAQVPEKIVQERSGHRSLDSLGCYERTSKEQHQAVSSILFSASRLPFTEKERDVKPDPDNTSVEKKCITSPSLRNNMIKTNEFHKTISKMLQCKHRHTCNSEQSLLLLSEEYC